MTDRKDELELVDALLNEARRHPETPPEGLLTRVATQAEAQLARTVADPMPKTRLGVMGTLRRALGGWPALGGLATATCAGLWVGAYPPEGIALAAETLLSSSEDAVSTLIDLDESGFDFAEEAL